MKVWSGSAKLIDNRFLIFSSYLSITKINKTNQQILDQNTFPALPVLKLSNQRIQITFDRYNIQIIQDIIMSYIKQMRNGLNQVHDIKEAFLFFLEDLKNIDKCLTNLKNAINKLNTNLKYVQKLIKKLVDYGINSIFKLIFNFIVKPLCFLKHRYEKKKEILVRNYLELSFLREKIYADFQFLSQHYQIFFYENKYVKN